MGRPVLPPINPGLLEQGTQEAELYRRLRRRSLEQRRDDILRQKRELDAQSEWWTDPSEREYWAERGVFHEEQGSAPDLPWLQRQLERLKEAAVGLVTPPGSPMPALRATRQQAVGDVKAVVGGAKAVAAVGEAAWEKVRDPAEWRRNFESTLGVFQRGLAAMDAAGQKAAKVTQGALAAVTPFDPVSQQLAATRAGLAGATGPEVALTLAPKPFVYQPMVVAAQVAGGLAKGVTMPAEPPRSGPVVQQAPHAYLLGQGMSLSDANALRDVLGYSHTAWYRDVTQAEVEWEAALPKSFAEAVGFVIGQASGAMLPGRVETMSLDAAFWAIDAATMSPAGHGMGAAWKLGANLSRLARGTWQAPGTVIRTSAEALAAAKQTIQYAEARAGLAVGEALQGLPVPLGIEGGFVSLPGAGKYAHLNAALAYTVSVKGKAPKTMTAALQQHALRLGVSLKTEAGAARPPAEVFAEVRVRALYPESLGLYEVPTSAVAGAEAARRLETSSFITGGTRITQRQSATNHLVDEYLPTLAAATTNAGEKARILRDRAVAAIIRATGARYGGLERLTFGDWVTMEQGGSGFVIPAAKALPSGEVRAQFVMVVDAPAVMGPVQEYLDFVRTLPGYKTFGVGEPGAFMFQLGKKEKPTHFFHERLKKYKGRAVERGKPGLMQARERAKALIDRYPKSLSSKVKTIEAAASPTDVSFGHVAGDMRLVLETGDLPSQVAHEMGHIAYREPGVRARFATFIEGKVHPERQEEFFAEAFEEAVTGKPMALPADVSGVSMRSVFPDVVDKAQDYIRSAFPDLPYKRLPDEAAALPTNPLADLPPATEWRAQFATFGLAFGGATPRSMQRQLGHETGDMLTMYRHYVTDMGVDYGSVMQVSERFIKELGATTAEGRQLLEEFGAALRKAYTAGQRKGAVVGGAALRRLGQEIGESIMAKLSPSFTHAVIGIDLAARSAGYATEYARGAKLHTLSLLLGHVADIRQLLLGKDAGVRDLLKTGKLGGQALTNDQLIYYQAQRADTAVRVADMRLLEKALSNYFQDEYTMWTGRVAALNLSESALISPFQDLRDALSRVALPTFEEAAEKKRYIRARKAGTKTLRAGVYAAMEKVTAVSEFTEKDLEGVRELMHQPVVMGWLVQARFAQDMTFEQLLTATARAASRAPGFFGKDYAALETAAKAARRERFANLVWKHRGTLLDGFPLTVKAPEKVVKAVVPKLPYSRDPSALQPETYGLRPFAEVGFEDPDRAARAWASPSIDFVMKGLVTSKRLLHGYQFATALQQRAPHLLQPIAKILPGSFAITISMLAGGTGAIMPSQIKAIRALLEVQRVGRMFEEQIQGRLYEYAKRVGLKVEWEKEPGGFAWIRDVKVRGATDYIAGLFKTGGKTVAGRTYTADDAMSLWYTVLEMSPADRARYYNFTPEQQTYLLWVNAVVDATERQVDERLFALTGKRLEEFIEGEIGPWYAPRAVTMREELARLRDARARGVLTDPRLDMFKQKKIPIGEYAGALMGQAVEPAAAKKTARPLIARPYAHPFDAIGAHTAGLLQFIAEQEAAPHMAKLHKEWASAAQAVTRTAHWRDLVAEVAEVEEVAPVGRWGTYLKEARVQFPDEVAEYESLEGAARMAWAKRHLPDLEKAKVATVQAKKRWSQWENKREFFDTEFLRQYALTNAEMDAALLATQNTPWGDRNVLTTLARGSFEISQTMRMLKAGFDVGQIFIFGLPLMMGLPIEAAPGRYGLPRLNAFRRQRAWGTATRAMFAAFKDPAYLRAYLVTQRTAPVYEEMVRYGGMAGRVEYAEGAAIQTVLQRVKTMPKGWIAPYDPGAPDFLGRAGRTGKQIAGRGLAYAARTEDAFSTFLTIARVELWRALSPAIKARFPNDDQALRALAASVNKTIGTFNPVLAGYSPLQRTFEGAFLSFAPMYRRALLGLLTDVVRADQPVKMYNSAAALGGMALVGGMMFALAEWTGNNPEALNPASPRFACFTATHTPEPGLIERNLCLGGQYKGLLRTIGAMWKNANSESRDPDQPSALDAFVRKQGQGQLAPFAGFILDGYLGETYLGESLRGENGNLNWALYTKHAALQLVPFWAETLAQKFGVGSIVAALAEFTGLNSFPVFTSDQLRAAWDWVVKNYESDTEVGRALVAWREDLPPGIIPAAAGVPEKTKKGLLDEVDFLNALQRTRDQQTLETGTDYMRDSVLFAEQVVGGRDADTGAAGPIGSRLWASVSRLQAVQWEAHGVRDDGRPFSQADFRNTLADIAKATAGYYHGLTSGEGAPFSALIDVWDSTRKFDKLDEQYVGDYVFELYMAMVQDETLYYVNEGEELGFDAETKRGVEENFWAMVGTLFSHQQPDYLDGLRTYVEERLTDLSYTSPAEGEYRTAMQLLEKGRGKPGDANYIPAYWEIEKQIPWLEDVLAGKRPVPLGEDSDPSTSFTNWQLANSQRRREMEFNTPWLTLARKDIALAQERLRRWHPEIDWALVRWLGQSEKYLLQYNRGSPEFQLYQTWQAQRAASQAAASANQALWRAMLAADKQARDNLVVLPSGRIRPR